MFSLFRAEWRKVVGNRWLSSFLIWLYPAGAFGLVLVIVLAAILAPNDAPGFNLDKARWTEMTDAWALLGSFPLNVFGRMPILAFAAVMFAGEYEWRTWKNVLPRRARPTLLLTKFAALIAAVAVAFVLMSLVWGLGHSLAGVIAGHPWGPEVTGATLGEFAQDYMLAAGLALVSTLIVAAYAALAALLTRSIAAGLLISFGVAILENIAPIVLNLIGSLVHRREEVLDFYRFVPAYNLDNIASWAQKGTAAGLIYPPGFSAQPGPAFSVAVLALWVVGLIALAVFLFCRQDIVS